MTRYFAIAIACLALLGGLGYVLREHLAAPPDVSPVHAAVAAPAASRPPDAAPPDTAHLVEVRGRVERKTGETWRPVAAGERLGAQDAIRTGEDGGAKIELGGKLVELGDRTEITVGEISRTIGIELAEGRVSAGGASNGRILRILVQNSDAVAESTDGTFDVLASGGVATVAAETGKVKLSAHGHEVDVAAGHQAVVHSGEAPQPPTEIPASLFLKVSAAGARRDPTTTLHGQTVPGAVVSIDGVRTLTTPDGTFETKIKLAEGKNVVIVLVEDARGRHESQTVSRVVQTAAPRLDTQVEWK